MGHVMSSKDRTGPRPPANTATGKAGASSAEPAIDATEALKKKLRSNVDAFVDTHLGNERRGFLDEARREAIERVDRLDQNMTVLYRHLEARVTTALRLAAFAILSLGATWVWIYMKFFR
jgi:hypothetical protein